MPVFASVNDVSGTDGRLSACGVGMGACGVLCGDGPAGCDGGYGEATVLSYAGAGAGDFQAETTYKYVGRGAGDFQQVSVAKTGWGGRCWCLVMLPLTIIFLWLVVPKLKTDTTTTSPQLVVTTTPEPYNCKTKAVWSEAQRSYCCSHHGLGCKAPEPNCMSGPPSQWDAGKKVWCCAHHHVGCSTPATTSEYDCDAGFSNWANGWSLHKKEFCCKTAGRGCLPTTSLPFDCNSGYHGCYHCLIKNWSVGKLAWCCQHTGRGCPTTPSR
mmetsp:Transcript_43148/g.92003  ORF Transcript_43148/g.92003 Transcript_43148/m.92003 type:complete len:269 (+) Transcript_43148:71-877(+)